MNDSLGDRMKGYENVTRSYLLRRTPVIIRIDGKTFHTYTKKFNSTPISGLVAISRKCQQDATRNSINMYARHFFSQKELHGKSTAEVMDMLMLQKNKNWIDLETWKKRGSCITRSSCLPVIFDDNILIFTQDRNYIEKRLEANNG